MRRRTLIAILPIGNIWLRRDGGLSNCRYCRNLKQARHVMNSVGGDWEMIYTNPRSRRPRRGKLYTINTGRPINYASRYVHPFTLKQQ
jgi:hypothetical protein